ncbi:MAG: helix-turn-helix domain-containing protein [Dehalococcoidia bacterium]|nr:helix-turn-helix domain-containing protein [Dehalococcoidia bacterium]
MRQQAPPSRADARANRERILVAAAEVLARRGLDAEVREIAEHAGVGVGTVYRHFESREGLISALIERAKEDILRRLRVAAASTDPASALRTLIGMVADACEKSGALAEAVLAGRLQQMQPSDAEFTELVADLLQRGKREGSFRADLDVPVAVAILRSAFTGDAFLSLAAQRSWREAARAIEAFFFGAIESTAESGSSRRSH